MAVINHSLVLIPHSFLTSSLGRCRGHEKKPKDKGHKPLGEGCLLSWNDSPLPSTMKSVFFVVIFRPLSLRCGFMFWSMQCVIFLTKLSQILHWINTQRSGKWDWREPLRCFLHHLVLGYFPSSTLTFLREKKKTLVICVLHTCQLWLPLALGEWEINCSGYTHGKSHKA